jgi:hypothetical protein
MGRDQGSDQVEKCVWCGERTPAPPHDLCSQCCQHKNKKLDKHIDGFVCCGTCGLPLHAEPPKRTLSDKFSDDAQTAWEKWRGI